MTQQAAGALTRTMIGQSYAMSSLDIFQFAGIGCF
jgi:hypothetical protein